MNRWDKEKELYQNIEIPKELRPMVRKTIFQDRRKRRIQKMGRIARVAGTVAAVLFMFLLVGLNSNYVFAKNARKIPIMGPVAEVLTVREYKEEKAADPEWKEIEEQQPKKVEELPVITEEPVEEEPVETISVAEESTEPPLPVYDESGNEIVPLSDFQIWIQEMTLEKLKGLPNEEDKNTEILAELPEEDIALYGYLGDNEKKGIFIRIKEEFQYFDWAYGEEKPKLYYADYNEDGESEVLVDLYPEKRTDSDVTISGNEPNEKGETPITWILERGAGKYNASLYSE